MKQRDTGRPRVVDRSQDSLGPLQSYFWVVAVLFFGVGDVVTTSVGMGAAGLTEGNPLAAWVIASSGLAGMVGLKLAVFGGCYLLWRRVPAPHAVGAPLGLALLGPFVTGWNLSLLLIASFS